MVFRKKYSRSSKSFARRRSRVRKKWRQQKLAVGTVAKIARKIATRLDNKSLKSHLFVKTWLADGSAWPTNYLALPASQDYRPIPAPALEVKTISELGGYVQDVTGVNWSANQERGVPIYLQGIQARFIFQNRTTTSVRVKLMLCFVPNYNFNTQDAVDFLRPDVFMLGRTGTGNLLYDGWNKQALNVAATQTTSARKFSILASKSFTMAPTKYSGQQIQSAQIVRDVPAIHTKHITLSKYFKGHGRKHYIKNQATQGRPLMDGNYFYIIWSDMEQQSTPLNLYYGAVTQLKFRVGSAQVAVNPL